MGLSGEIVEVLIRAGLGKNPAKVVAYLLRVRRAMAREIEIGADLRQSEVSMAMKELRRRGWIVEREVKRKGVGGRSPKEYELTVDLRDILRELIEERRRELDELKNKLSKLEKALLDIIS